LGVKFFLGFQIYFWVGLWKCKGNDKSKGNNFVASPFGLRSGLRQSGSAFRRELFVGLKPHANPKSNNKAKSRSSAFGEEQQSEKQILRLRRRMTSKKLERRAKMAAQGVGGWSL
jgi:hypothetical protein